MGPTRRRINCEELSRGLIVDGSGKLAARRTPAPACTARGQVLHRQVGDANTPRPLRSKRFAYDWPATKCPNVMHTSCTSVARILATERRRQYLCRPGRLPPRKGADPHPSGQPHEASADGSDYLRTTGACSSPRVWAGCRNVSTNQRRI